MQKAADPADISVLFFPAGANFWAMHANKMYQHQGETFLYFLKSIKKEKQRSTEYTSNRVINPSKASRPSRTSHKPEQLDVSREILSAQA